MMSPVHFWNAFSTFIASCVVKWLNVTKRNSCCETIPSGEASCLKLPINIHHLTRDTIALILAGGRGSRLMNMTDWRAKPAVPFGGKFRIIDFPLSNCVNSGIRKIGILTQYKADSLIRHVQQGWGFLRGEFGEYVDLMPAQQRHDEDSWYKGTADAVFQNIDILRTRKPEHILILAGDHIYKMNYAEMLRDHVEKKADLTIGCIEVPLEDAKAFGVIGVDANRRVTDFVENPKIRRLCRGAPIPHWPRWAFIFLMRRFCLNSC